MKTVVSAYVVLNVTKYEALGAHKKACTLFFFWEKEKKNTWVVLWEMLFLQWGLLVSLALFYPIEVIFGTFFYKQLGFPKVKQLLRRSYHLNKYCFCIFQLFLSLCTKNIRILSNFEPKIRKKLKQLFEVSLSQVAYRKYNFLGLSTPVVAHSNWSAFDQ